MKVAGQKTMLAGGVGLALLVVGFVLARGGMQHALLVYLAGWLFVLALVLGSLSLLLIHALTGGAWGLRLRPELLAATGMLPYLIVAVLPLLLGMHSLFPWLHADAARIDPDLDRQRWYLNPTGLVLRTVIELGLWQWLAWRLRRGPMRAAHAAPGLLAMAVTVTLLAVDWVMSLVPHWYSTDIGLLLFSSQLLLAFALAVWVRSLRTVQGGTPSGWRDFANLLLAMVLGWAYVSFMDFLTAWVADLPSETAWYLPRTLGPWPLLALALAVLGLGLPFFGLLPAGAKSSRRVVAVMAAVTVIAQAINVVWLILPGVVAQGAVRYWGDPFLCVGLLGLCASRYRAMLPSEDPAP